MQSGIRGLLIAAAIAAGGMWASSNAEAHDRVYWAPGCTTYYAPAPGVYRYSPGYYDPGFYSYAWPGFTYFRPPAVVLPRVEYYGPVYYVPGPKHSRRW